MFKNYDGVLKIDGEVGNKKAYDPRAYLALGEASMAERVKLAVSDLRGTGKTMFASDPWRSRAQDQNRRNYRSGLRIAADIEAVRAAAAQTGRQPFIIAKIERADALDHFDEILAVADGVMVARGDLGVEIPIEKIAYTQKQLIAKANLAGKPVITATQMLESMVNSRLPTRAEATDVANAILDGTDCVMLSGESAMGKFPEEAVTMLARIAAFTEAHRPRTTLGAHREFLLQQASDSGGDRMTSVVENALDIVPCDLVLVPTRSGTTARIISRFKPNVWMIAPSVDPAVCQGLAFSYGVHPVDLGEEDVDWREFAERWLKREGLTAKRLLLVAGPSKHNPKANHRIELMRLEAQEPSAKRVKSVAAAADKAPPRTSGKPSAPGRPGTTWSDRSL
jgi:pyruvate kinase